jgi:hypothetical protein
MTRALLVIAVLTIVIALMLAVRATLAWQKNKNRIAIPELEKKLNSGEEFLLIDVREDWELEKDGAIPGAIHIPITELEMRMKDVPKDVQLVFY